MRETRERQRAKELDAQFQQLGRLTVLCSRYLCFLFMSLSHIKRHKHKLDGQGRARRKAARRRKSECQVNLDILNSSRSSASERLQKLYHRSTWRMDLRQLTAYEYFGCVNMRAITFLFVDQSSSRDSRLL